MLHQRSNLLGDRIKYAFLHNANLFDYGSFNEEMRGGFRPRHDHACNVSKSLQIEVNH